jgi:hypothetical protein
LHGFVPEFLHDDPQVRHILVIHSDYGLGRAWRLDEALAVPHKTADIHPVVENSGAGHPKGNNGCTCTDRQF